MKQMLIQKQIHKVEPVEEMQTLKSMLSSKQLHQVESGEKVAMCDGSKLRLDDMVTGTVVLLSPLVGG